MHQKYKKTWYWLIGLNEKGGITIVGPYEDEEQATQIGVNKFASGEYEVIPLPYRDEAKVTRILKGRRLQNETLNEALQRVRHQKIEPWAGNNVQI